MSEEFKFWREVPVRFADLDSFGHVHHSCALMYIEEARAAYWRDVAGRPGVADIDYVIGSVSVRYHERIMYPENLRVGLRVGRIGGRSITMEYEIRSQSGELLVSAEIVQIMFDVATGSSFDIPAELRAKLESFESTGS